MSYQVLARRFRPQTFASIAGQEQVTRALANAILLGRVPHAVLLTGPRGVGKTTSARVFARALNCTGRAIPAPDAIPPEADPLSLVEPCGECPNCKEIARSTSLAVWEVDGASNNSVDNVRDLIDSLRSVPPPGSKYKIYIIDEVHMLSVAAFNALLKSLEEPPPNTVFIFATTEPHKIPDTVLSRCQRHDFRRLPISVMVDSLRQIAAKEQLPVGDEVLELIATKARGGMRDAQSMLDRLSAFSTNTISVEDAAQQLGVVDAGFFFRLSEAVLTGDAGQSLLLLDEAFQRSVDNRSFTGDFLRHFRNLLLVRSFGAEGERSGAVARVLEVSGGELKQLTAQAASKELFDLQRLFDVAEQTARTALSSAFPRYVFEAGVVKMASLPSLMAIPEIVSMLRSGASGSAASGVLSAPKPRESGPVQNGSAGSGPAAAPRADAAPKSSPAPVLATPPASQQPAKRSAEKSSAPPAPEPDAPLIAEISWEGFLSYLKDARSEPVLLAYLRRVSAKVFVPGKLTIEAAAFDCSALSDQRMLTSIRENLVQFSGHPKWDVRVVQSTDMPVASLAVKEKEELAQKQKRLEAEARSDPAIQAALSVFEGSSIERIVTAAVETEE